MKPGPMAVFSCGLPEHGAHIPHLMTCERCGHRWIDCPGEAGTHYKTGCRKCMSLHWSAEPAKKVGKLKELIKANKVN